MEIQELIDALNFTLNTSCGNLTPQTIDLIVDRIHELKEQLQALKIPQKPTWIVNPNPTPTPTQKVGFFTPKPKVVAKPPHRQIEKLTHLKIRACYSCYTKNSLSL